MGKYFFRKQIRGRGCLANIELDVETYNHSQPQITVNYLADEIWKNTCLAGADIFFDYYNLKNNKSLRVNILNVGWLPVDTNHIIVLYSIIEALSKELKFEIRGFHFEEIDEKFVFPEPRRVRE